MENASCALLKVTNEYDDSLETDSWKVVSWEKRSQATGSFSWSLELTIGRQLEAKTEHFFENVTVGKKSTQLK